MKSSVFLDERLLLLDERTLAREVLLARDGVVAVLVRVGAEHPGEPSSSRVCGQTLSKNCRSWLTTSTAPR